MRRAHRRAHLLVWLLLAPAVAFGLFAAIARRPVASASDLPASIAEEAP